VLLARFTVGLPLERQQGAESTRDAADRETCPV
jgi:hypothetical protein